MRTNYYDLAGTQREAYKTEIDCIRKNILKINSRINEISLDTPELEAEFDILLVKRSVLESVLWRFQMMIVDQIFRNARIRGARAFSVDWKVSFEAACRELEINPDGSYLKPQA